MKLERLSEDWNELAEEDALWAVLAEPGKQGRRWDVGEFLATGEREVAGKMRRSIFREYADAVVAGLRAYYTAARKSAGSVPK